jgi:hypothetical protein
MLVSKDRRHLFVTPCVPTRSGKAEHANLRKVIKPKYTRELRINYLNATLETQAKIAIKDGL